ncbi:MAG: hypothetical protein M3209_16285 [Acidobacteriota bacterium]|nr:hypothetical protein [Acidobacteriota bacterium]
MNLTKRYFVHFVLFLALVSLSRFEIRAQGNLTVLTGAELTRGVRTGFYFEGQSAPSQMRNAAVTRLGGKRRVIAGLVDTSGYSTEIRAKYEGFLITDSIIEIGGEKLGIGAYGFGFTDDGKLNVFDIGGNRILSISTANDKNLRRPRPLMMAAAPDGLRFYSGRSYAVISAR